MWQRIGTQSHSAYEVQVFWIYYLNICVYMFVVCLHVCETKRGKQTKRKRILVVVHLTISDKSLLKLASVKKGNLLQETMYLKKTQGKKGSFVLMGKWKQRL